MVGAVRLGGPVERAGAPPFTPAWISTLLIQSVAGRIATPAATLMIDLAVLARLLSTAWTYGAAGDLRACLKVAGLAGFGAVGAPAVATLARNE